MATRKHPFNSQTLPTWASAATFFAMLAVASLRYTGFFSAGVFVNLLGDNAFLGISAVGMTFVILSGGIDLSVGSVIGLSSIVSSLLVERVHFHPAIAGLIVLGMGSLIGAGMGFLICFFELAPFLVTLGGMFLARGVAYVLSLESIHLDHPFYEWVSGLYLHLPGGIPVPVTALIFLVVVIVGIFIARSTRFGRNTYAIGGAEASAVLMGIPVARTKISIYALNGFCSALAGIVYTFYTSSGNANAAMGLELDAIAAVVIGGTLLTGGAGYVIGTLVGVLILGMIQTAITFESGLSSWWTKIVIGGLLFGFILLQRLVARTKNQA